MAEIPEIVRRRLRQPSLAESHPDENLLAAFVEGAIPQQLRSQVLGHLSACSACRRVVAISSSEALSEIQAAAAVYGVREKAGLAAPVWRWSWGRWASLRWASAVAAVVLIVGAAWIGRTQWQVTSPAHVASVQPATDDARKTVAGNIAPAAEPGKNGPDSLAQTPVVASSPSAENLRASSTVRARENSTFDRGAGPVPSRELDKPQIATNKQHGAAELAPEREKISPAVAIGPTVARPTPPNRPDEIKWMTRNGILYQSFDQGARWQSVVVKKEDVALTSVVSRRNEVWVAAKGGNLYHSSDNGRHWNQVVPSAKGAVLSGDIERLKLVDANSIEVTSNTGITWVTADNGVTWEKR